MSLGAIAQRHVTKKDLKKCIFEFSDLNVKNPIPTVNVLISDCVQPKVTPEWLPREASTGAGRACRRGNRCAMATAHK